jgi:hypothetical protein
LETVANNASAAGVLPVLGLGADAAPPIGVTRKSTVLANEAKRFMLISMVVDHGFRMVSSIHRA